VTRWAALTTLALALGCSSLTEGAGGVVELEVMEPSVTTIAVGETLQLTAGALDKNGNPVAVPITWRTADATLSVTDAGLVTGLAPGAGQVQAIAGTLSSAAITLTVTAPAAPGQPLVGSR
jgi:DNA-binding transcriptional regulator LsrR (DeoR family)